MATPTFGTFGKTANNLLNQKFEANKDDFRNQASISLPIDIKPRGAVFATTTRDLFVVSRCHHARHDFETP